MLKKLLILFAVFNAFQATAQEVKDLKERAWVNLKGTYVKAKSNQDSIVKRNILFNSKGEIISYQTDTIKTEPTVRKFSTLSSNERGEIESNVSANLTVVGDKIMIFPWIPKKESAKKFLAAHDIYVKMVDRHNYSFWYSSFQLTGVTMPIKMYLSAGTGNVQTAINPMLGVGLKVGKTRFVKFPHEKDVRNYKALLSLNGLVGISKIELDESNTSEDNFVKGDVAAVSAGVGLGFHYRDFVILVTLGKDHLTSNRSDWNFTNKPWLGLGFGFKFL